MSAVVYVNGTISPEHEATIPVFDHGFLYGAGVYETLRTYARMPFLFDRHVARLRRSAARLALDVPLSDEALAGAVADTLAAHPGLDEAYIRILLTRGVGDLSYNLAATPSPSLVIIVKPLALPPDHALIDGIAVALVGVRRNHPQALDPAIKSNNLLNLALAMQEAQRRGADEALMQNLDGELVECSQANFFLVRGGAVLTPPLSAGLLAGITREFVLESVGLLSLPGGEARLTLADLETADEAFITGTTREITPVTSIDGRKVGNGRRGPLTLQLLEHFRQRVRDLQLIPR